MATNEIVNEGFRGVRAFVARNKKMVYTDRKLPRNPARDRRHNIKRQPTKKKASFECLIKGLESFKYTT